MIPIVLSVVATLLGIAGLTRCSLNAVDEPYRTFALWRRSWGTAIICWVIMAACFVEAYRWQ